METKKDDRHGVPLSVRVPKPLYDQLKAEQQMADDQNLTRTVERLLNQALRDERRARNLLQDVLDVRYGPDVAKILLGVATALESVGTRAFAAAEGIDPLKRWHEHPFAFAEAVRGAVRALNFFKPKASVIDPPAVTAEERRGRFWGISGRRYLDERGDEELDRYLGMALVDSELADIAADLKGEAP